MSSFDWRVDEKASWPPRGRPDAPYAPTGLEVLRSCALRRCFECSRGYERRMSFDGRIGAAFHRTLEWLSQRPSDGKSSNEVAIEVRSQFAKELGAQEEQASSRPREKGLPRNEARVHSAAEALLAAAHQVRGTTQGPDKHDAPSESAEANEASVDESGAEVEVPVRSRDGRFSGKVDRAERTADGVRLIDYKSALRDDLPGRYERQVQLYAAMWRDTRGEYPSEAMIVYPLVGTSYQISVDPEACHQVVTEYSELISSLEANTSAYSLATPGDTCKICEFRPWCKPFWHWQARERDSSTALEFGSMGFEGIAESIQQVEHHWRLTVRWRGLPVRVIAPIERFPHLKDASVGSHLRVLDAPLKGLRHRPTARVTEYSEIFILEQV